MQIMEHTLVRVDNGLWNHIAASYECKATALGL